MEGLFCPRCGRLKIRCKCIDVNETHISKRPPRKRTCPEHEPRKQLLYVDESLPPVPHFYIKLYVPKYRRLLDDFSDLVEWFKKMSGLSEKAKKDLIDYFAEQLIDIANKNSIEPDVIVPIPSHKAGEISEGLKLLAETLSDRLKAENYTGALVRVRTVRKSSWSSYSDRPSFEEHYESFRVNRDVSGKRVLLIDDVCTLGNTSRAAAKRLFEAGAKNIWLLTLAKTARIGDNGEAEQMG